MRRLLLVLVVLALVAGAVYVLAGRAAGPTIQIHQPQRLVGVNGAFDLTLEAPGGALTSVEVALEQQAQRSPLFTMSGSSTGVGSGSPTDVGSGFSRTARVKQETAERIRVTGPLGKGNVPALRPGAARLVVTATRPVLFGLRQVTTADARDVEVRLDPPRLSVISTHHFVRHGGAEMVVYRVAPPEALSGVRVGDQDYPGYPASGAGITGGPGGPDLKVAFFALLHDQDVNTPISLFARDEAGNEAKVPFDHRIFPRPFRRSRIDLDDGFLARVVAEIATRSPEVKRGDDLQSFLAINRDLRQRNNDQIAAFAKQTAPRMLWQGPFHQLTNSQVEASFADHRTYFHKGQEVDQQVHLGFDLAVTANVPVVAANRGTVLFADSLGIYGNTIIIDHGMGVQSLYGHLSSIDVKPAATVEHKQAIGRSGMTGLAGGDHLHFTMLVQGKAVSPVEWWDPHWIEDRVLRKLTALSPREAPEGSAR